MLERLEELTLGKNYFETVPDLAFRGLRKLRSLDLSECPKLRRVAARALEAASELTELSLSASRGVELAPGSLASLAQLTDLRLADLGWTSVPRDLAQWEGLQTLDLGYNPLVCDCGLAWLRDLLQPRPANTTRATCAAPAHLAARELRTVAAAELRCGGQLDPRQQLLAASCVLAALLTAAAIVVAVHCHCCRRKPWRRSWWRSCRSCPGSSLHCDKYSSCQGSTGADSDLSCTSTAVGALYGTGEQLYYASATSGEQLYYAEGRGARSSLATLPDKLAELYYADTGQQPRRAQSAYCDPADDYFLSLSKDRKTFKPIRVCEL